MPPRSRSASRSGSRRSRRGEAAPESLSRASYYAAALDVLAEDGPGALTITELCRRLQVTKGSFYHHFEGRAQFVEALLGYWAAEHASRLISVLQSMQDPAERMAVLKGIAITLPHDAEAAIRAWSSQDRRVAAVQAEVDRSRLDHLRATYLEAGLDARSARVLSTIAMSVLAGMQMLVRPADPALVRQVFDQLERWTVGEVASAAR